MKTNLEQTADFHRACGLPIADRPGPIDPERVVLRARLLREEVNEAIDAIGAGDLAWIAKELADVLSVTYGAALEYGIPLDVVYALVNHSNVAKAGGPLREDGKLLKPESWTPPDVEGLLRLAGARLS